MWTVYKYKLEATDLQIVQLPAGAQLLTVQKNGGEMCLWALVDTDQPLLGRKIRIVGTGNKIAEAPGVYLATVQMENEWGTLVWHVFDAGVVVPLQG